MINYKELEQEYVAHTYGRWPICIQSGKGCRLTDEQGKQYLDFTSGIGVSSLGYAHPQWVEAVSQQAAKLAHVSNLFYTEPMLQLAQQLCQRSGLKKVFFANSGAEANEGAIKVARKYGNANGGKNQIISLVNSFHGRTMATLSATGQDSFHTQFDPFLPGFVYAKANDIQDLKEKITSQTGAILIEMVQGEGGVIPLEADYVRAVQTICDEKDILLIVDEVQTGMGRTGTLMAYQQYNLHPDIVTLAKGLGAGLPIGAVLMNEKVQDVFQPGDHGSTFGGNPIACAGALVVMDVLDDEYLDSVKKKGQRISQQLRSMPHVQQVNGLGMMIGVELDVDVKQVIAKAQEKGVLFLSAKDKLRLLPPLVMTNEEIDEGMEILKSVLEEIQ